MQLRSVGVPCVWEGPVIRAHVRPYDPADWDEKKLTDPWRGGIYALDSVERACQVAEEYDADAIGEVDLWGRVVRFEMGYRAELCMIRRICVRSEFTAIARSLSRQYECDVVVVPVHKWPSYSPVNT